MHEAQYTTDTSPEAAKLQLELVRQMTSSERVAKAIKLTTEVRRLSFAALRRRYPSLSEDDLKIKFIHLHYGAELAKAVEDSRAGVVR